jgi:hypothetical protein
MTLTPVPYLEPRPGAETERCERLVVWLLTGFVAVNLLLEVLPTMIL